MKTMKINTNENKTEAIKLHFNMYQFRNNKRDISVTKTMLAITVFTKLCNIDFNLYN